LFQRKIRPALPVDDRVRSPEHIGARRLIRCRCQKAA
jgi:hypothetical protein